MGTPNGATPLPGTEVQAQRPQGRAPPACLSLGLPTFITRRTIRRPRLAGDQGCRGTAVTGLGGNMSGHPFTINRGQEKAQDCRSGQEDWGSPMSRRTGEWAPSEPKWSSDGSRRRPRVETRTEGPPSPGNTSLCA